MAQKTVQKKTIKTSKITNKKHPKKSLKVAEKQIPLFNSKENNIQYRQNLQNFTTALRALKRNKTTKLTILHIGDSHIQAGLMTDKLRALLQNRFGNGGRGLIFPYKTAKSTQPDNYLVMQTGEWQGYSSVRTNVFSTWGLSGFTVVTEDEKATLTLQPSHKKPERITKVKIFYPLFDKKSFDLKILAEQTHIKSSKIDADGYAEYVFKVPQKLVSLYFQQQHKEQKQFILQGLTWENDNKGVVYHTAGVNGADIESFLRCADFQKHIKALEPDLVIISLGANDILVPNFKPDLFKINYKILLRQIKKANPNASILITSPNVSYNFDKKPNSHLDLLVIALQELATTEKLAFWDFYTLSGKKENVDNWSKNNLLKNDKVHLLRKGYELQAQELFNVLIK
jgi:lysophospholipase L1-like esterase